MVFDSFNKINSNELQSKSYEQKRNVIALYFCGVLIN